NRFVRRQRFSKDTGEPTGDNIVLDINSNEGVYIPSRMQGVYEGDYKKAFKEAKGAIVKTSPRDLYTPEFEHHKQVDRQKLKDLQDPRSISWRAQELANNWLEPHGVYNWLAIDELLDYNPNVGASVIEKADEA